MTVVSDVAKSETISMQQSCDNLLIEAGLPVVWQPDSVTPELTDLVRQFNETTQPGERSATLLNLGKALVTELDCHFKAPLTALVGGPLTEDKNKPKPAFRAHTAKARGIGNCMGLSEGITGLEAKIGLQSQAVVIWDGHHVKNGLVDGDQFLDIDGFYLNAVELVTDALSAELKEAWENAVRNGTVTLVTEYDDSGRSAVTSVPLDKLSDLVISPYKTNTLILPAPAAVVAFCGLAAQHSDGTRYPKAKEVLGPCTPIY